MKKFFCLILVLFIHYNASAQIEVKAVMGINFLSTPSMQDYINFSNPGNQLGSFNSAVIFAAEAGYYFSPSFVLSVEGGYQLFSYTNLSLTEGKYELVYNSLPLSVIGYYVLGGNGYNIKFGGGAGPRFINAKETLRSSTASVNYRSTGIGMLLRAEGNTLLGGNFYANIGVDLRYDLNGEPENNGEKLFNSVSDENVNFNSLALGIRLGFSYYFGAGE
jgi:hypothetical protein